MYSRKATQEMLTVLPSPQHPQDNKIITGVFAAIQPAQQVEMPSVSVVIPTLNEAKNLPHVLPKIPTWVHEVIIVDGRSTDDTIEVAKQLLPDVRIVLETRKGKGVALRSGFEAVTGDVIVMLDADGSTDPEEIPVYVGALLSGADFAKGSRFAHGAGTSDMESYRWFGNQCFTTATNMLFGSRYTDLCYGYNAFWTYVLPLLELDGDGFEIETMMNVRALKAGLQVMEVPSFEADRINGTSNLQTIPDGLRVLHCLLKEWATGPTMRCVPKYHKERDEFSKKLIPLLKKGTSLVQQRDTLNTELYQQACNRLMAQYQQLLQESPSCKISQKLNQRHASHYSKLFEGYLTRYAQ